MLGIPAVAANGSEYLFAWEDVREAAFASTSLLSDAPSHFLHPSRYVPRYDATVTERFSLSLRRPATATSSSRRCDRYY